MGLLVEGTWQDKWYDTGATGGAFVRQDSQFRDRVEAAAGSRFPAEAGRYHLYVSLACPWAHRTIIVRALKGLEAALPMTVVSPLMLDQGWVFDAPDPVLGATALHQVYTTARPRYSGRVTVPVLFDTRERTIVNNESAEILRMLNTAFDGLATRPLADLYPPPLRDEIDALNADVYAKVNNGVYRAGFATQQGPYDEAVAALFAMLDSLERRLEGRTWLVGDQLTEADIRLFTTLVRFDAVYYGHFKCNLAHLWDHPNLCRLVRTLHAVPGVAETIDLDQIKRHYYISQRSVNPSGIVPAGPPIDFATLGLQ